MKCYFAMLRCSDCNYPLSREIRDFRMVLRDYSVGSNYWFHHPDNDEFERYRVDRILVLPMPSDYKYPFAVILISAENGGVCNECTAANFELESFVRCWFADEDLKK